MRKALFFWICLLGVLLAPVLACSTLASRQATPTPTKTPKRVQLLPPTVLPTPMTVEILPTTPPTDTPPPIIEEPTPIPPPTDTPLPPPTDTPVPPPPTKAPPPPPTKAPPPPPTNTPAPPPPTQPPAPQGPQISIQLPNGNDYDKGKKVKIIFVVTDPNGVGKFTWGIFTQNMTPLMKGDKDCGGATECREEIERSVSVAGTYRIGVDAVNSQGVSKPGEADGVAEIYVH